ncbi:SigB/SigF/SigG family RNA polymerase sigma factor [Nocardioides mangrovi]|uniref:SigB/SigF/SigG family RNA polymerase sigma factor n=1 Tax=Nocardioides mangrovi TaxID=2874580 RepID=A0ABS7U9Z9_9ACTN|nr:SigB/SigF/SigG family RNA polymerase sigma factor [Nocardioides mangrovi]MBZ5737692.1 SigB/SigF/SigG family RNA polymerase sigma factor [Nocardioides mangrovi]
MSTSSASPSTSDRTAAVETRTETTARLFAERSQVDPDAPDAYVRRGRIDDDLVRLNMPLARDLSRRFRGRGIADDDLEQVAYVGLVKAVHGFDPSQGNPFASYAVPTIRGEIRRHFRDLGWAVRPPRSIQETQQKISGCEAELYQELGRAPRPSEIAAHLGLELEQVIDALGASGCFAPTSLDAPTGSEEGDESVGMRIGASDPGFDLAEARATLAPLLAKLSRREQLIVEMRFFRGCTQAEIGAEIGVSQMQVSRLLTRLVARMRQELASTAPAA